MPLLTPKWRMYQAKSIFDPASGGGGGGITVNGSIPTSAFQPNGATMDYNNITVAAGSHTAMLVTLIRRSTGTDSEAGVAIEWDHTGTPQPLALLASSPKFSSAQVAQVWGLLAPTTGNKVLRISWTNAAADNFVGAVVFDGVAQANNATAFPHFAIAAASTVAVTSTSGNVVVGAISDQGNAATLLGSTIFFDNINGSIINGAADYVSSVSSSTTVGAATVGAVTVAGVDVQAG